MDGCLLKISNFKPTFNHQASTQVAHRVLDNRDVAALTTIIEFVFNWLIHDALAHLEGCPGSSESEYSISRLIEAEDNSH